MIVYWILHEWMMNYCMLTIGWVNDELLYAEYRMSEWWMVVYWI